VDKLTYAALEGTLLEHLAGRASQTVPVHRMLSLGADRIAARAGALGERLAAHGWRTALVSGASAVGGGSAPGVTLPTTLLTLERDGMTAASLEAHLRTLTTPVVARIVDDCVALDLRTISAAEEEELARLLEV
jgi:L-seryl-tRNA(Ser) seleniumtransferase